MKIKVKVVNKEKKVSKLKIKTNVDLTYIFNLPYFRLKELETSVREALKKLDDIE